MVGICIPERIRLFIFSTSYETGPEPQSNLIIHNDADLYSATLYVLATCDPVIRRGTILLFDEFYSILHEFKAFQDYTRSFMRQYAVVGYVGHFAQVAIRVLR